MPTAICKHCRTLFDPSISPFRFGESLLCSRHTGELEEVGNTGPGGDYADIYRWSCCGEQVIGPVVMTESGVVDRRPPRSPGCEEGPHEVDDSLALTDELSDLFESIQLKLDVIKEVEVAGVRGDRVFISYSHKDKELVDELARRFKADKTTSIIGEMRKTYSSVR